MATEPVLTEQAPDPLNIAEATLALVTLTPVLAGDMPYIGLMKQREIVATPKRIASMCDDLVQDQLPRKLKMTRDFDYFKLLGMFTNPLPEVLIEQVHGQYQSSLLDQAIEFTNLLAKIHQHLAAMVPVSAYDTVLGPMPIQPPGDVLWSFWARYWVISNPLVALSLAQSGALLPEQVACLSEFYPSLYEHMKTGVLSALVKHKAKNSDFINLPPRIDRGITTLKQERLVPFGSNTHQVKPDPLQQPAGPVTSSAPSRSLETTAQRTATL